ncbi:MAG: ThuA domain-containing protein [Balneolia bacterium]|nr:ThuA domain-containing protein [Balneolia bacterium]
MTKYITLSLFVMLLMNGCGESDLQNSENDHDHDLQVTVLSELRDDGRNLLIFSKTSGWRHDSIEAGIEAVGRLAGEHEVGATATEDADYFTPENLEKYDAVVFLNTTQTVFDEQHRRAFNQFIQNGGGFAGVHSASDTEYDWPWYHGLVGAYFDNHPNDPNVRNAVIDVVNPHHASTEILPERWQRDDEWYNFQSFNEGLNVLLKLDTDSYQGSDHPGNHPVAWYHEYDGGRAFYTALGHTKESFSEDLFLQHLWGGIEYAMGK